MSDATQSYRIFDDILKIEWDGGAWVSPCNGHQHATEGDAMRAEIVHMYEAGGDDPESKDVAESIYKHVDRFLNDAICPACKKSNPHAYTEGATEGPREYHAECWDTASETMTDDEISAAWKASSLNA